MSIVNRSGLLALLGAAMGMAHVGQRGEPLLVNSRGPDLRFYALGMAPQVQGNYPPSRKGSVARDKRAARKRRNVEKRK